MLETVNLREIAYHQTPVTRRRHQPCPGYLDIIGCCVHRGASTEHEDPSQKNEIEERHLSQLERNYESIHGTATSNPTDNWKLTKIFFR